MMKTFFKIFTPLAIITAILLGVFIILDSFMYESTDDILGGSMDLVAAITIFVLYLLALLAVEFEIIYNYLYFKKGKRSAAKDGMNIICAVLGAFLALYLLIAIVFLHRFTVFIPILPFYLVARTVCLIYSHWHRKKEV